VSGEGCPRSGITLFVITGFRFFGRGGHGEKNLGSNSGERGRRSLDAFFFFHRSCRFGRSYDYADLRRISSTKHTSKRKIFEKWKNIWEKRL